MSTVDVDKCQEEYAKLKLKNVLDICVQILCMYIYPYDVYKIQVDTFWHFETKQDSGKSNY